MRQVSLRLYGYWMEIRAKMGQKLQSRLARMKEHPESHYRGFCDRWHSHAPYPPLIPAGSLANRSRLSAATKKRVAQVAAKANSFESITGQHCLVVVCRRSS